MTAMNSVEALEISRTLTTRGRVDSVTKLSLLAFLTLAGQAAVTTNQISLPSQAAAPGSSLVLPIILEPRTSSLTGLQFDLQYDNSVMSLAATIGDAARGSAKSLYYRDLATNNRRFLIIGFNQNVIPPGSLVELFVNLNPSSPNGAYALAFSNLVAKDGYGKAIPATSADGTVTIEGTINQSTPLQLAGVLNAASFLPGPVAPGEVVTLFGSGIGPAMDETPAPFPSSPVLANITVLFDGLPAPLLYAAPTQINLVVPFGVSAGATSQVQISKGSQVIAAIPVQVAAAVPAIFTLDASGVGRGAILNQDWTLNSPSNPATRGSIVALFATGAGQFDPPLKDGQVAQDHLPKPVLPVSVEIGGLEAEVVFAGAAPGLIAGALQVNCRIPAEVAAGYAVPIVLRVGSATSQLGVTLATQ